MNDIFYKLPRSKAKVVIQEAMSISDSIVVDELNCSKSFRRVPTSKTPLEIFSMGLEQENTMWNFIIRKSYCGSTDIGLSTMPLDGVSYFLWIRMSHEKAIDLANKHELKLLQ